MILPEEYPSYPLDLKALWQFKRHLLKITRAAGYNNDVTDVYINRKDFENASGFCCNLVWGPEEVLNANDMDRSLGVVSVRASVYTDWILNDEDPARARSLIKADCLKYFLQDYNYWLPELDNGNQPTIFNLMPAAITPYGDDQQIPKCKLEIEWHVWYRTQMGNPYGRA